MRFLAVASIVAVCIAGAALAQETPSPAESQAPEAATETPTPAPALRWRRMASGRDFANNYPSRALDANAPGVAVLCCTVLANGRLDCTVPFEWPRDYGFGEATLRIAREFRLTEESAAQVVGGRMRRQVVWLVGSRTPQLDEVITRIREGTQNVCGPAIDWSERAPGDIVVSGVPETRPQ